MMLSHRLYEIDPILIDQTRPVRVGDLVCKNAAVGLYDPNGCDIVWISSEQCFGHAMSREHG